jgi:hypothetical protein
MASLYHRGRVAYPAVVTFKCRAFNTQATPPHAYLSPLPRKSFPEEVAAELSSIVCLTMDRRESRNALSVRMVMVSSKLLHHHPADRTQGDERMYSQSCFINFVRMFRRSVYLALDPSETALDLVYYSFIHLIQVSSALERTSAKELTCPRRKSHPS